MKKISDKFHISKKALYMSGIALILILLFVFFASKRSINSKEVGSIVYNAGAQELYDGVIEYLTNAVGMESDDNYSDIASEAVENYDKIISSGVTSINSDHTEALQERIRYAVLEYIPEADEMTDEYIELLSANITEMIINNIIEQVEALSAENDTQEYDDLYSSLKEQAEYLSDKEMQITITATIKDSFLNAEMLFNLFNNMTDQEKDIFAEQLAAALGTTKENLYSFIKSSQINPDVLTWLTKIDSINDLKGDTGAQGEKGDKGDKGDTGDDGDKGDTGATGAQGEKGDKGDTGAQGEKGDKGDKGDTGATGAQGEKGDKGDTGAQGEKGDKGDKGDTGVAGAQGEKGDKGDTGVDGYTPIKGIDYLTDDDVNDMASKAASISESNLQAILGDQVTYRYDSNTNTLYITTK